jgi:anti-sigma factor ChrR (cupin superfamily)
VAAVKPVAPPKRLWDKIAARIDKPTAIPGTHTVRADEGALASIAPGVSQKTLFVDAERGERTFLLRMAPGSRVDAHDHDLDEECFVLEGKMVIGGVEFDAGDYHLAPKHTRHREITAPIGALILIRAAVAEHAA